jgi:protein-S-isoprenylcysteine O-methyltransferase Ste14
LNGVFKTKPTRRITSLQVFYLLTATLLTGPPVDRVLTPAVGRPGWMAVPPLEGDGQGSRMGLLMVVAGLDHRWGWPPFVPDWLQVLAALGVAVGYGLGVWAMVENRYFSAVARIQKDRGQEVVTSGPYRMVRHPAYAGALLASLALPLMLDALWALVHALVMVVGIAARTNFEDRMLIEELEGYLSYTKRTRYRLVPGVW